MYLSWEFFESMTTYLFVSYYRLKSSEKNQSILIDRDCFSTAKVLSKIALKDHEKQNYSSKV